MSTSEINNVTAEQLKSIISRVQNLEEEKKNITDDISEVFLEAKGNGFDVKVIKKIIALLKKDENERAEEDAVFTTYMSALGMSV